MSLEVEQLYYQYGPMVLRRCSQMLKDMHLAEEAMQDVFVKVLSHRDSLDLRTPSSLLYRIATNVCLNHIRNGSSGLVNSGEGEQDILLQIANDDNLEKQAIIERVLAALFGRQVESTRIIVTLYFYDGMTLQEVAEETGMSVSGVRKRLRTFKEKVEKYKHEIEN